MKTLLSLFLLLFSSSVIAEDISDFKIEQYSIGKNLLDFLTKDKIYEEIKRNAYMYDYLGEPNKYGEVYIYKGLQNYNNITFFVSGIGNEYIEKKEIIIEGLTGTIEYNNIQSCLKKRDELENVFITLFSYYEKETNIVYHPIDPSGKSQIDEILYFFDSGDAATLQCYDFEENLRIKNNWIDGLVISLYKKEVYDWLSNY